MNEERENDCGLAGGQGRSADDIEAACSALVFCAVILAAALVVFFFAR